MKMDGTVTSFPEIKLMSSKEAAKVMGLSHRTLEDWRLRGFGPRFRKIGRSVRYQVDDLRAFIDANVFSNTGESAPAA